MEEFIEDKCLEKIKKINWINILGIGIGIAGVIYYARKQLEQEEKRWREVSQRLNCLESATKI